MEWFQVWLYNMTGPFFWVCIAALVLCAIVMGHGAWVRAKYAFASSENIDARWRQHAAVQGAAIIALLMIIFSAIPAPDYNVRTVERRVPVRVEVPGPVRWRNGERVVTRVVHSPYRELFEQCMDNTVHRHGDSITGLQISQHCHIAALRASGMRPFIVYRDRPVVRTVERRVPVLRTNRDYFELFQWCNEAYTLNAVEAARAGELRNQRLEICHRAAIEATNG